MEYSKEYSFNFSECLFAYFYKNFISKNKLSYNAQFVMPKPFITDVAEYIIHISDIFKIYLRPIFEKSFHLIKGCEVKFMDFVKWSYNTINLELNNDLMKLIEPYEFAVSPEKVMKFLILCSFIKELVCFSFEKKCYFFTTSGPTCLAHIILAMPQNESNIYFFRDLNNFCNKSLHIASDIFSSIFKEQSVLLESAFVTFAPHHIPFLNEINRRQSFIDPIICEDLDVVDGKLVSTFDKECSIKRKLHSEQEYLDNFEDQTNGIHNKSQKLDVCKEFESEYSLAYELSHTADDYTVDEFQPTKNTVDEFKPITTYNTNEFTNNGSNSICAYCHEKCVDCLVTFFDEVQETNYDSE